MNISQLAMCLRVLRRSVNNEITVRKCLYLILNPLVTAMMWHACHNIIVMHCEIAQYEVQPVYGIFQ